MQERRGVKHLRAEGKGGELRYVPLHPAAAVWIEDYLAHAGHADEKTSALFRALRNPSAGGRLSDTGVYTNAVPHYGRPAGR